jgi:ribonuclease-3
MMQPTDLPAALNLTFCDEVLLTRALTHRSYLNENPELTALDNERLEFLGDAVLDFLTGDILYQAFPDLREGELTNLRSALVKRETLARFAVQIVLSDYMIIGKGERAAGGHLREALLAGAFEALIGAVYLDQGLEAAKEFWLRFVLPELQAIRQGRFDKDAKSKLQELSQGALHLKPTYRIVAQVGPDHAREYVVEAQIGERVLGEGRGLTKQNAEQQAAKVALEILEQELKEKEAS